MGSIPDPDKGKRMGGGTAALLLVGGLCVSLVLGVLLGGWWIDTEIARSPRLLVLEVQHDRIQARTETYRYVDITVPAGDLPVEGRSGIRTGDLIDNPYYEDHGLTPDGS